VKILRLSAALAALILTASTACAAVVDFGNDLGPSGRYTSQTSYQTMLGGQPMTAAQQAYADLEDELRQLGFRSELGGDFALGQMFYHMAYGVTPASSASDSLSGGSGLGPSSISASDGGSPNVSDGSAAGSSDGSHAGFSDGSDSGSSNGSDDSSFVDALAPPVNFGSVGIDPGIAVPEASTWAMMLIGFAGLGYAGWRGSRKPALHSA
jgi:hypothetical protein